MGVKVHQRDSKSLLSELDDVFIRKDLYDGKYKPHPERLKYFQQEYDLTECTNVV